MVQEMVKSLLFPYFVASMLAASGSDVMKSKSTELLSHTQEKTDSEHTAVCEIVNTDNRKKCQNDTSC